MKGYFLWSLMDLLHGQMGITKGMACFMLILETQKRYPKKNQHTGTSWSVKPNDYLISNNGGRKR